MNINKELSLSHAYPLFCNHMPQYTQVVANLSLQACINVVPIII